MIFDPACRRNAIKNILLTGVGVTALPSLNVAVANNYAGLYLFCKSGNYACCSTGTIYSHLFCQKKMIGTSTQPPVAEL